MVEFEVVNSEVKLHKNLTKLDLFVIETISILKKYTDYVLISGYVSIFFGRARATEDVDIFIDEISEEKFKQFYDEATSKGLEFNIDHWQDLYKEYLTADLSINLWRKNLPLIRLEIKIAKIHRLPDGGRLKAFVDISLSNKMLSLRPCFPGKCVFLLF